MKNAKAFSETEHVLEEFAQLTVHALHMKQLKTINALVLSAHQNQNAKMLLAEEVIAEAIILTILLMITKKNSRNSTISLFGLQ